MIIDKYDSVADNISTENQKEDTVDYTKLFSEYTKEISEIYDNIKQFFVHNLHIKDPDVIDIIFATALSKAFPDDPVWLGIIGTPSAGKTEIIRGFGEEPTNHVYPTSKLTENALASGSGDVDTMLATELNGKLWVIKDLTTLITNRPERLATIISHMREIYDGYISVDSGVKKGTKRGKTRTTLIFGVTTVIDNTRAFKSALGERIIYFRIPHLTDEDDDPYLTMIMNSFFKDDKKRNAVVKEIQKFMDLVFKIEICVTHLNNWSIQDRDTYKLAYEVAKFISQLRVDIEWDYKKAEIEDVSEKEGPARLTKQLVKLMLCLRIIRGQNKFTDAEKITIVKIGMDCVPRKRIVPLIKFIRQYNHNPYNPEKTNYVIDNADIIDYMKLEHNVSYQTARRRLDELEIIKVLKYSYQDNNPDSKKLWNIHSEFFNKYKHLFDYLKDNPQYKEHNIIKLDKNQEQQNDPQGEQPKQTKIRDYCKDLGWENLEDFI